MALCALTSVARFARPHGGNSGYPHARGWGPARASHVNGI